jgi:hypothetical protein
MITIAYSTRSKNDTFKKHLLDTVGIKNVEIIETVNNGNKSLTEVYNNVLELAKNDIVVLCHDDIFFDTKSWGFKLLKHFEKTDFGILGVAGTTHLLESGTWWENRNKMLGIVGHQQGDKKWVSKYSTSLGNDIEEVVIVDGLFIAVNKKLIKNKFNEDFKNFHFYDLSFCLDNFLSGCKIGVIYNINITHLSIGITNQKWEENRRQFIETYKDVLPVKLPFNWKRKPKVLISCLSFKNLTGSELYVYELSKELIKIGWEVYILSNIGNPLQRMAEKNGVKCFELKSPPGYKMGDGVWSIQTEKGFEKSQPNVLYADKPVHFDIIHTQHKPITDFILRLYPNIPKIATIHSEIINLEEPVKDNSIKNYIAIRQSIKDYIQEKINIEEDKISIIYNPIDNGRFNNEKTKDNGYYLFVGTIDYLRINSIKDIIEKSEVEGRKVLIIGEDSNGYLKNIDNKNFEHINSTWDNLPKYVKECYKVVGIKMGRTTIEGWLCGKTAIIYDVDESGNIISISEENPPLDLSVYRGENVAMQLNEIYIKNI